MQPKSSSQRTADLRFRSRHAASNERLAGILSQPGVCQPRAEHTSALYCGTQGIQGEPMFPARAPIGSLDAVFCAFPIPALHMRIETDRSLQATPRRNPLVPSVHQAIQHFAGICSRHANCPRLIWTGHERLSISLATGPAYWPPIDSVKLSFSSLYGEGKYTSSRRITSGVACSVFIWRSFRASRRSQVHVDQHLCGASDAPCRAAHP